MKKSQTNITEVVTSTMKYGIYGITMLSIIFYNFKMDGQWQDILPYFVLLMITGVSRDWIDLSDIAKAGTYIFDIFLVTTIGWVAGGGVYFILFFVIISEAAMRLPILYGYAITAISVIVNSVLELYFFVFVMKVSQLPDALVNCAVFLAVLLFILSMSFFARSKQEAILKIQELYDRLAASNRELELAHLQMKEYASKVEELTVSQERNRFAREIHDTLGHTLMGIIVSLEVCKKMVDKDIEKAREEIIKSQEAAKAGLHDVRQSIQALRPKHLENHSFTEAIMKVIEEARETTGLDIQLQIEGDPFIIYPSMEVAIYRSIQEALTNAVRHGKASNVTIDMMYQEQEIRLEIQDNGKGCAHVKKGFGLIGMKERAEALRGKVEYYTQLGEGFHITLILPVRRFSNEKNQNIDCR